VRILHHLHVLSSTLLNDVNLCLGTGKRINLSASVLYSCLIFLLVQRLEGSSEKSWFGTAYHLHCTPSPSLARFSGLRTNLIHAWTTSRHGPSTGESLVQHRWGIVVCMIKSIRAEPIFFGTRTFFI